MNSSTGTGVRDIDDNNSTPGTRINITFEQLNVIPIFLILSCLSDNLLADRIKDHSYQAINH